MSAGEVAAEAGDAHHVEVEGACAGLPGVGGGGIEKLDLHVSEDRRRGGVRIAAPEHGHPVDAPGDDAAERDAVGEAIGGG